MNWNGEKASRYFEQQYRSTNPDSIKTKQVQNIVTKTLYDVELVKKDFYLRCAENAWTKDKLLEFLSSVIKNGVNKNSSSANDEEKYSQSYINFAKEPIKNIENGKINFQ